MRNAILLLHDVRDAAKQADDGSSFEDVSTDEMTKLMAIHRSEGSGSIFYSMAPDGSLLPSD